MIENVCLDILTVFGPFKCQRVTPVGIHKNEFHICFLVEVAVLDILNKLTPYGLFKLTPIDNL